MRIKRKFKLKLMKMRKSLRWGFVWHVRWGWINFKWATQGREGAEESGKAGDSAARRVWKPATTRRLSAWNVCAFNLISSANLHVCSPCRKWRRRMRRHSQSVWLFFSFSLPLSLLYSLFPCLSGCHFDPIRLCAVPRVIQILSPICATWALKPQINSHTG